MSSSFPVAQTTAGHPVIPMILAILTALGFSGCFGLRPSGSGRPAKPVAARTDESRIADDAIPPDQLEVVLEAHYRGVGMMERYDYDKVIEAFREVHGRAPDGPPGSVNLAIALMSTGNEHDREQALILFDKALSQRPDDLRAHYCRGIVYESLGLHQKAHAEFQFVVGKAPGDGHAGTVWLNRHSGRNRSNGSVRSSRRIPRPRT